jgi:orotate phosphoribosyltransferase
VLIALDRQERGQQPVSAVTEVSTELNMPIYSIIKLEHIIEYLNHETSFSEELVIIKRYYSQYGCP